MIRIPVTILNDTRTDRHHGCERVMSAIEQLAAGHGMEIVATHPSRVDWKQNPRLLRALEKSRLVIVNGEGTLHHDVPAAHQLLQIGAHARSLGIPAVLVNAGWEANGPALLRMLSDFAIVAARDSASAAAIRAGGPACRVVPDLSFYGAVPATLPSRADGPIGFTDSVDRFKAIALDACRRRMDGMMISIVFPAPGAIGHARFVRHGFAVRDVLRPAQLARIVRMRHALARHSCRKTAQFFEQLARCGLLVSGRFHACTLAMLTGTPFVGIASNTGKIAGLVADAGLEAWRAQGTLEPAGIRDAQALGWTAHERAAIRDHVARARSESDALFRDIAALA